MAVSESFHEEIWGQAVRISGALLFKTLSLDQMLKKCARISTANELSAICEQLELKKS